MEVYHTSDVVIEYPDTVDLYTEALISKEEAIKRLAYIKPNIQYCIRTDAMLQQCLMLNNKVT